MTFVEVMLMQLCNLSLGTLSNSLFLPLSAIDGATTSMIIAVMRDGVFAVGASLLTLFMLIELIAMINRAGADNGLNGVKLPANIMLRFGIYTFLYINIPTILGGIEAVAVSIGGNLTAAADYNFSLGVDVGQISTMANAIEDLSFFTKIWVYLAIFLCWLIVNIINSIVGLTVTFRLFELWLLLLFSPIPLATFASTEMRQTALNFLKLFAATCLQGSAIIACFLIYQSLVGSTIMDYDPSVAIEQFIFSFLVSNITSVLALAMAVMGSSRIIKQVMNVI